MSQRRKISEDLKKSKNPWSIEDDDHLQSLMKEHGTSWIKIASYFPGRDAKSCQNRVQYLKRRPTEWTEDEDNLLKQAVKNNSKSFQEVWKMVAEKLPSKTWQQLQ
ncbi:349_t:CDS:2 [Entrophospora sp. SA101]|nr:6603_t:CDS:2 [Entrophospora candida]CAH1761927.1 12025_t:CDS:2 [Entrophospora sp. SA101]CAG8595719.1 3039_t:CDS:2 [Entrophospora candida]CAJ0626214.1 15434_t:CDS:2 [Entrophospora sp. SA101]CAJ0651159.1 8416_t:CDS:2 [Entrophospora sp. SA101]